MTYGGKGYRPGPLPRYQPHRFNPLPYIVAGVVVLVLLVAGLGLFLAHPWASPAASPTPTLTPIPSLPPCRARQTSSPRTRQALT